ncbi:RNA polymerase III subunit RPC82-domain-containing protein [Cercophora scortea]|uniref:DNA-directed RNA polymerase III subunit RPC3 n=1 Tax=Cercophora scortea TaxID=314031 RepID=A0AAE0I919_9PEZI|nr:RNA polymerase III subunit RPC82-domain-containing protein [Cercophora scortea]
MLVTKYLAELCSLLIDDLYGELPSRIFAALLLRGRSSLPELCNYTSMSARQLRHGLAVLHQHNLLFYQVDSYNGVATYEANAEHAYNLIRAGKILEMIDTSFGAPAKDVMQSLLLSGQTRIGDLVAAYQDKIDHVNKAAKAVKDETSEWDEPNGTTDETVAEKRPDLAVKSTNQLNAVICRLVEAELIDVVHSKTFQTSFDIYKAVEKEVMDTHFPGGPRGGKAKVELQQKVAEGLRKVRDESKSLKRKLDQNGTQAKRRKLLFSGGPSNGVKDEHEEADSDPVLDSKQVIRINYEKCLVDLRNRRLVQFATDMIGPTTAYVYGVFLGLLTKRVSRCRLDPEIDITEDDSQGRGYVTTDEILDNLKTSIDLSLGLGKAPRTEISSKAAEKILEDPPKKRRFIEEAEVDGNASADESDDEGGSDTDHSDSDHDHKGPATNGTKVKFADSAKEQRLDRPALLRQHLLLLAESTQRFVRHCGHNDWTVDFVPLMRTMRESELDVVIERTSGREGLRLVRILRSKGKLDEKALPNVALMRKAEIQQKMLEMQTAGFVDIQEVPRDNKADVKKSFFLWFCDSDRSLRRLLDNSYKTMLRCIQVLEVLRQKDKDVLMLTKRSDVRGQEKDVMEKVYYDRYSRFLANEKKLFAQIMRIDDLVSLIRDY